MNDQVLTYLFWLKSRGEQYHLAPHLQQRSISHEETSTEYGCKVLFCHDLPFNHQEKVLMSKVLSAMNLLPQDVAFNYQFSKSQMPSANEMQQAQQRFWQFASEKAPQVIVGLGAIGSILSLRSSLEGIKEKKRCWQSLYENGTTYNVFTTYHPRDLIRDPDLKRHAWEDYKKIIEKLGTTE